MTTPAPALPAAPPAPELAEAEIATLAELFDARVARTPHSAACRSFDAPSGSWHPCTWLQLAEKVARYSAAVASLRLPVGARVALKLENSVEWLALEQAIFRNGLVSVGLYANALPETTAQLLADSGAEAFFVRDAEQWAAIRAALPLPALQAVITLHEAESVSPLRSMDSLLASAAQLPAPSAAPPPPARDALASLVYTSGSNGLPKAAMLSHGALLANCFALARAMPPEQERRVRLSILPLSHSFERVAGWYYGILCNVETVFSRGVEQLADDLMAVQPTALIAVPRLYEHLYARVLRGVESAPMHVRALFHLAQQSHAGQSRTMQRFSARMSQGLSTAVRQSLGGQLTTLISGGAPLCPLVSRTFAALGLPILQGYGLTEAGPVVSVNRPNSNDPESVGEPLDNVTIKVAPDGELLVRSPSMMQGYWQDDASTQQAIDENGWLHTGDKASRLESAQIYLTGRIKDLLVTSTGMKVAPSVLEARLTGDPFFDQAVVVGEARPYLSALLVAEPKALAALRAELGLGADYGDAEARRSLEAAVLEKARSVLRGYATATPLQRIALVPAFTLKNGLMTSTGKPKRVSIFKAHAAELARLYEGHCGSLSNDCSSNAETGR